MKFERMSQTNIHGYQASVGDRTVEVIRSYAGDWFVYALIGTRVCKARSDEKRPMSYADAMRDARAFLNRTLNLEVYK